MAKRPTTKQPETHSWAVCDTPRSWLALGGTSTICRNQPRDYHCRFGARTWCGGALVDQGNEAPLLTKAITAVAAATIIVSVASTSAAKDSGPPTIDIQKTCRENVNELRSVFGRDVGQDMSVCLMDEQDARDQIVKDWANYPTIAKERCVQPKESRRSSGRSSAANQRHPVGLPGRSEAGGVFR
jgi:hypothetical protein